MVLFWYFAVYSFFGFLLEIGFAWVIHARKKDRKCFLLLPLCPVYGLGALAIMSLPQSVQDAPLLLVLLGGLAATGAEYFMAVVYEKGLGVSFWDYSEIPGNWQGRVCPLFSLFWGLLAPILVHRVHPMVVELVREIPDVLSLWVAVLVAADGVCTAVLLHRTRSTDSLRWYDMHEKPAAG